MKKRENLILILPLVLLLSVICSGFFAISLERQETREIGRRMIAHERTIKQLERDNDNLTVKIAKQINPSLLTLRASTRLAQPQLASVVWGYENYEGGRIYFKKRPERMISFKAPEKKGSRRR